MNDTRLSGTVDCSVIQRIMDLKSLHKAPKGYHLKSYRVGKESAAKIVMEDEVLLNAKVVASVIKR